MDIRRLADRKQSLADVNQETGRQKARDSQVEIRRLADGNCTQPPNKYLYSLQ